MSSLLKGCGANWSFPPIGLATIANLFQIRPHMHHYELEKLEIKMAALSHNDG